MDTKFYHGDCRDILPQLKNMDAVVTDPPYGLNFMGKGWDHGVPGKEYWELVFAAMKPGAYLLAFGGTRTFHRLTCAIEDAGFEIRDCLMWVYGSGFPKSHDVSKAIDKAKGKKRKIAGQYKRGMAMHPGNEGVDNWKKNYTGVVDITEPASEEAKQWEGWGTALKPAWEPIILARKPLDGSVANNTLKHGCGGLNIDGCRVGENPGYKYNADKNGTTFRGQQGERIKQTAGKKGSQVIESSKGRWPANLILSHHPDCEQVGHKKVKTAVVVRTKSGGNTFGGSESKPPMDNLGYADPDGLETIEKWNCHPDCPVGVFPERKTTWVSSKHQNNRSGDFLGELKHPGEQGFNDSGSASRFFYCAKASKKERGKDNNHPTVKPLALMRYLCRLIIPPNGVVLDPFMGSGSTLLAARQEGFSAIGIDIEKESVETSQKRLEEMKSPLEDFFADEDV